MLRKIGPRVCDVGNSNPMPLKKNAMRLKLSKIFTVVKGSMLGRSSRKTTITIRVKSITANEVRHKLEATEMWFLRRMLRIPWTAKKTNERVLNEANKRRSLVRTIRKRQATFLGHVMRREKLEHLEQQESWKD
ncbi:RNA-directed DNA polymerase from mobile element jockey [Plakobranchus ocellatus]|uniref:RNA-directed DNA polymerase from mobile element jockey n=1 Tax=Plakobranchus ocellatus TaxID=259542 RepID=A0AAV3YKU9_9GAST|nr:RNA-directed DNA polymerase from mobile element jockey [Plakobranchus ocellatus]